MDKDSKLIFEKYAAYRKQQMLNEVFPALVPAAAATGIGIGEVLAAGAGAIGLTYLAKMFMELDQADFAATAPAAASALESFENAYEDFITAQKSNNPEQINIAAQQMLLVAQDMKGAVGPLIARTGSVLLNGLNKSVTSNDSFYIDAATVASGEALLRALNTTNQMIQSLPLSDQNKKQYVLSNQQLASQLSNVVEMAKRNKRNKQQNPAGGNKGNTGSGNQQPTPTPPPSKGRAAAAAAGTVAAKTWDWVSNNTWSIFKVIGLLAPALYLIYTEATGRAKQVISNLGDAAVSGSKVVKDVGETAETVSTGAKDAVNTADEAIRQAPVLLDKIGEGASSAYESAVQSYEQGKDWLTGAADKAGETASDAFSDLEKALGSTPSGSTSTPGAGVNADSKFDF